MTDFLSSYFGQEENEARRLEQVIERLVDMSKELMGIPGKEEVGGGS